MTPADLICGEIFAGMGGQWRWSSGGSFFYPIHQMWSMQEKSQKNICEDA
jgi:hypothetical protein